MNTEDLRALAERAEAVKGRPGLRLAEVHGRIRTARRRRGAAAAAGSAAVVLALAVGSAFLVETRERGEAPIQHPTPTALSPTALSPSPTAPSPTASTPTEASEIPAGQVTVIPDIRAGDVRGWETVGTRTNAQAGYQGATDLSMTLTLRDENYVASFCHASPDTWWSSSNSDGAASSGPCSLDDPVSPPPPHGDLGPRPTLKHFAEPLSVRMFVFKPTNAEKRCLDHGSPGDCQIRPAASTDASFGFAIHEHRANRWVLHLGKDLGFEVLHLEDPVAFEALAVQGGREYITEKAVVAARGAHRIVVYLDPSDRERFVAVSSARNKRAQACDERYRDAHRIPDAGESAERALGDAAAKFCGVEYALKVDDRPAQEFSDFGDPWMYAPAGARTVTVDVTHGDPRNASLAVVIWKARP